MLGIEMDAPLYLFALCWHCTVLRHAILREQQLAASRQEASDFSKV